MWLVSPLQFNFFEVVFISKLLQQQERVSTEDGMSDGFILTLALAFGAFLSFLHSVFAL